MQNYYDMFSGVGWGNIKDMFRDWAALGYKKHVKGVANGN